MPTLNLGVIDIPYAPDGKRPEPKITKKGKVRPGTARRLQRLEDGHDAYWDGETTTAVVAQLLQDKYGLFQVFYDQLEDHIAGAVVHSLEGALEDLYSGAPMHDPYAEVGQEIDAAFRVFLMTAQIESLGIPGVPTKAAIERRSSRFKSKKGPSERPSFVDTGTLEASLKSWIE